MCINWKYLLLHVQYTLLCTHDACTCVHTLSADVFLWYNDYCIHSGGA